MDDYLFKGITINVYLRVLTNTNILLQCLYLNGSIPWYTNIPMVLIFDDCKYHYNYDVINNDIEIMIILVLF